AVWNPGVDQADRHGVVAGAGPVVPMEHLRARGDLEPFGDLRGSLAHLVARMEVELWSRQAGFLFRDAGVPPLSFRKQRAVLLPLVASLGLPHDPPSLPSDVRAAATHDPYQALALK